MQLGKYLDEASERAGGAYALAFGEWKDDCHMNLGMSR